MVGGGRGLEVTHEKKVWNKTKVYNETFGYDDANTKFYSDHKRENRIHVADKVYSVNMKTGAAAAAALSYQNNIWPAYELSF